MLRARNAHTLVEQASYRDIKHASYLKGLLKPFKGKGELVDMERQMLEAQSGIADLMNQVIDIWAKPPFALLQIDARLQPSTSGSHHLRWRTRGRGTKMGVGVWSNSMLSERTPVEVLDELYWFEVLRIRYNMQMTCIQFMINQARECQVKLQDAELVLQQAHLLRTKSGSMVKHGGAE